MKKMPKFPIICFLVAVVVIAYVFLILKPEPEQPEIAIVPIPQPSIPVQYTGKYTITLDLDKKSFNFPSSASAIKLNTSEISDMDAKQVGKNLGFQGEPKIIQDYFDGTKYFWKNEKSYLSISTEKGKIKFNMHNIPSTQNKQLSDESVSIIAKNYLISNFLVQEEEIKFSSLTYLRKPNNIESGLIETNKENASLFRVIFTPSSSEFELLTLSPQRPLYFVEILPDGNIYQVQVSKLTNISETNEKYNLLNYEEVNNSLDKAILVGITGGYVSISDIKPTDIKSVKINKIKLAYLLDSPDANIYSPVFLLTGPVEVIDKKGTLIAQLYLPAIKSP